MTRRQMDVWISIAVAALMLLAIIAACQVYNLIDILSWRMAITENVALSDMILIKGVC